MIIAACAIMMATVLAAYQYLSHRVDGKCRIRDFFVPVFSGKCLIAALAAMAAAGFVFWYGCGRSGDSFMRGLMNAEVMIWLFTIGYVDLYEKIIPNSMIGLGLLAWLAFLLMEIFLGGTPWVQLLAFSGIGGLVCGGILMVIALFMKAGLGMGDVKMFFVLGLLYGLMGTYGIFLFTIIPMGVFCIVLLLLKKATRKTTIPMAPFVVIGFFLSIIAGM